MFMLNSYFRWLLDRAFRRYFVDLIAIAFTDGNHDNNQFFVTNFIDQSVSDGSKLDLVTILLSNQQSGRNSRVLQALFKPGLELCTDGRIELVPLFESLFHKPQLIGHRA